MITPGMVYNSNVPSAWNGVCEVLLRQNMLNVKNGDLSDIRAVFAMDTINKLVRCALLAFISFRFK